MSKRLKHRVRNERRSGISHNSGSGPALNRAGQCELGNPFAVLATHCDQAHEVLADEWADITPEPDQDPVIAISNTGKW